MNTNQIEPLESILPRVLQTIIDRQRAFKSAFKSVPGVQACEIKSDDRKDNDNDAC